MLRRLILTLSLVLSLLAFFFSLSIYLENKKVSDRRKEEEYLKNLIHLAKECLNYQMSISDKESANQLINRLDSQHYVLNAGGDEFRSSYVTVQGCIEQVLACSQALGQTHDLKGMIHTPTPATPLCTRPEPTDSSVLDESIRYDLDKLLTVRSRAQIIRDYLQKGGVLYAVYPLGGLEKRSLDQQLIYLELLKQFPKNLIDWKLKADTIDSQMIGATYFFKSPSDRIYVFSIKAPQVNAPQNEWEWGLWLGPLEDQTIKKKVNSLFCYFKSVDGPPKECFISQIL